MKTIETTLENAKEITSVRRDGNTVRLVDNAIQILFRGKICICLDHKDMGENKYSNLYLMKSVLWRLNIEFNISNDYIRVDYDKFEIELLIEPWAINKIISLYRVGNLTFEGEEYMCFKAELVDIPDENDLKFIGSLRDFFVGSFVIGKDKKTITIPFRRHHDIPNEVLMGWLSLNGADYNNFLIEVEEYFKQKQ